MDNNILKSCSNQIKLKKLKKPEELLAVKSVNIISIQSI